MNDLTHGLRGALLVAGTTSDAGKSVITTGLCRLLSRRGVRVAPFKAQNMSNNSMVVPLDPATPQGPFGEIGRAQWIQSVAAGAEPEVAMNPVLLKPGSDTRSHVVVNGLPAGDLTSAGFTLDRDALRDAAYKAVDDLSARYDVVIAEGAGSPAEINLRQWDFINMGLARHAEMPVLVVGDIDRGGVYAALYGTLALLEPDDQRLISGFVVNKFRGDASLLTPAHDRLAELTGRRVLGVVPWHPAVWLDSEDALDVGARTTDALNPLRVKVIRLPRISNFTDVDALGIEPGVDLQFAASPRDLAGADLVVVPGTRATLADLAWLRERGLDAAITRHVAGGGAALGICGGFQMLGRSISDPDGVESTQREPVAGLGLIDVQTTFTADKVLGLPTGSAWDVPVSGYEIHHGRISCGQADPFPGGARHRSVFGTMWHGSLEGDAFRSAFLLEVAASIGAPWTPSGVCFAQAREARLELLADLVEANCDVEAIVELIRHGATDRLPVVHSGPADDGR